MPHKWKVYARREPTTDSFARTIAIGADGKQDKWLATKRDVVIYRDHLCREQMGSYVWFNGKKPTRRHKRVTVNCVIYHLVWLRDKRR